MCASVKMYVLVTLFIVFVNVEDARSEDFCKLESNSGVQYCFDPSFAYGLRRCNSYEPTDVILRPGCNAPKHYSNDSLPIPKRCNNGKWEDLATCSQGPECTWKGVIGKCVNIYRCLSAENIFEKKKPPVCGYQGNDPMVCCTDCSLVDDSRQIIFNKRLGFLYKNGRKAHDKCIDFVNELDYACSIKGEKRVEWMLDDKKKCFNPVEFDIGNQVPLEAPSAYRSEFPHVALVGFGSDWASQKWLCSGSLITHNFILTAAHCADSKIDGPATYVALGITKLTDPPEQWQLYKVNAVIKHPNYSPPSKYNDIALLKTVRPVLFNVNVRPACLHVDGNLDDDATAVASGSVLNKINLGDTLLPIKQNKFSNDECILKFPPVFTIKNGYDNTTQLCYGDRMGIQDTCIGDSGGPLNSREHFPGRCVFTLLGVLSFSRGCRSKDNPESIYTRVQFYVPWIESIVWP